MTFAIGDRVRIRPDGSFRDQAQLHPGLGTINEHHGSSEGELWYGVIMDDGYDNAYRAKDLIREQSSYPLPDPEMSLEEIEQAKEVYHGLQDRR